MAEHDIRIRLDLRIPMRDGIRLYGALYLPATGDKFPTLLVRTIYSTQRQYDVDLALRFARHGYAVALHWRNTKTQVRRLSRKLRHPEQARPAPAFRSMPPCSWENRASPRSGSTTA